MAIGAAWLGRFVGAENAMTLGIYPFIPGECLKIIAVALIVDKVKRLNEARHQTS